MLTVSKFVRRRMSQTQSPRSLFVAIAIFFVSNVSAGPYLLVNGPFTVVKFDLATGDSSLVSVFEDQETFLRNILVGDDGDIFVSTFGRNKNVVKLEPFPGTDLRIPVDFTPSIGNFGPAQMAFYDGDLFAAGDRSRAVFRYDGQTGEEISQIAPPSTGNIRGMTIGGDYLYFAEIFQDRISRFDLTTDPPSGGVFINAPFNPDEPYSLVVGHNGNLFVGSRNQTVIQEFNINTGAFVGTLVDLQDFGVVPSIDGTYFTYAPELDNYFATFSGGVVYQFDTSGELVTTFESPLLFNSARGMAFVVPESRSFYLMFGGIVALIPALVWTRRRISAPRR